MLPEPATGTMVEGLLKALLIRKSVVAGNKGLVSNKDLLLVDIARLYTSEELAIEAQSHFDGELLEAIS